MKGLPLAETTKPGVDYPEAFRRLYYHLYSNSAVSRAERLVEDLSLLLLTKLAAEVNGSEPTYRAFMNGKVEAEDLLDYLRSAAPGLVDESAHFAIDDDTVRTSLAILESVKVSTAPAHAVGEAFQALIGPRLRGERGQFFTPRSLVQAMVRIVDPSPNETVVDPACGTGGFLLEVVAHWESRTSKAKGRLMGSDKDAGLARLAAAVLKIAHGPGAEVVARNSLDPSASPVAPGSADVVLTNPPFGAKIGITDVSILESFALGHRWTNGDGGWSRDDDTLGSQDPQVLFLELCVRSLREGGRLGIVLPEGIFGNRRTGYVWDWLRDQGEVTALIDCPRTTFQPGTDTKTNVLFFRKGKRSRPKRVPIAVALECGHDRRGRTTNAKGKAFPNDFEPIATDFIPSQRDKSPWWHEVEIADPYYVVPRFYAPQEAREPHEVALTEGAQHATLESLIEDKLVSIRKGVEVGSDAYGTGTVPFVRTSDISNFEIKIDPTKGVDEAIYDHYAPALRLAPNDILMVVDGRYRIGATALLTARNSKCVVQSHFRIISALEPDKLDAFALLYALNLPSVKQGIRNLVFIQSTLGTLGRRLLRLEIPLLIGEGPWTPAVSSFRHALLARDDELARLRAAVGGVEDVAL